MTKKKKKVIRLTIPVDTVKKIGKWIKEKILKHLSKISLLLLIVTFVLLGMRIGCNCNKRRGMSCSFQYDPPNTNDVKNILKK